MHAQYVYQKDDTLLWIYWREAVCVTEYNQPSKVPMEMSGNLAFAFHALNTIGLPSAASEIYKWRVSSIYFGDSSC